MAVTSGGFVGVGTEVPLPGVPLDVGLGVGVLVGVPTAAVGVPLPGVAEAVAVAVFVAVAVAVPGTAVPPTVGLLIGVPTMTVLTIVTLGMGVPMTGGCEPAIVAVASWKGGGVTDSTATGVDVPATSGLGCTICSTSKYHKPLAGSLPQPAGPG